MKGVSFFLVERRGPNPDGAAKEIPNGAMTEPWQPDREKRLLGAKRPKRRSTRRRRPGRHDMRFDCLKLIDSDST